RRRNGGGLRGGAAMTGGGPVLFVTNHAPPERVAPFALLSEREDVEFVLFGGRLRHGAGDAGVLPFPHRRVREREVLALAAARGGCTRRPRRWTTSSGRPRPTERGRPSSRSSTAEGSTARRASRCCCPPGGRWASSHPTARWCWWARGRCARTPRARPEWCARGRASRPRFATFSPALTFSSCRQFPRRPSSSRGDWRSMRP